MKQVPYYAEGAFTEAIVDALEGDQQARNMRIGLACTGVGAILILLSLPSAINRRSRRKEMS